MIGCLTDNREKPPAPVADVKVAVEDESDKVVGEGTSNETGIFDIALPGSSVDNLGKSYTIKIDKGTLPEGTSLVDPKKTALTTRITTDADIYVTFPIGEKAAAGAGKATQLLQLTVGGITFSLLLALAALGLSLIFGTTGLTNFAHGELVTFGALAALAVDRLPGEIRVGGANITFIVAVIFAFIASGVLRLGAGQGTVESVAQARNRPGRDDDHHHRALDLPAQPLPVRHRWEQLQLLPVRNCRTVLGRSRADHRTQVASRSCPSRSWLPPG